jgi:hypothetical protein
VHPPISNLAFYEAVTWVGLMEGQAHGFELLQEVDVVKVDVKSSFAFAVQRRSHIVSKVVHISWNRFDFDVEDFFLQNFWSEKHWQFGVDFADGISIIFQGIRLAATNIDLVDQFWNI